MIKKIITITFLAMTLLMTPAIFQSAHATELVTNGSFEVPNIPTPSFVIFGAIPGWTSTIGGGIEIQDNVAGAPGAGNGVQFVELDSTSNSNMKQTLTTVAGASYVLSFDYSPRPNVGAGSNGIDVFFDGINLATITAAGGAVTNWSSHQFLVTATGASTVLEFRAVGTSDSLGGYIDVVSVIELDIDIKPGSDPNSINTKSKGVVPVAILGSATFDVTTINVATLLFGPGGATPAHNGHLEDVNNDGFTDLVLHFKQMQTGLMVGDTLACITGALLDGTLISGCDSVNIVK